MAAGLSAILFIMPRLLDMIFREKSGPADVRKLLLKFPGPQVTNFLLNEDKKRAVLYMVAKALGPLNSTFVGAIAQLET